MAVSYTTHSEFTLAGKGQTIFTFADMTLTLNDSEGGGENALLASELGFESILFCSNARNNLGELIVATPDLGGAGLYLWYNPQTVDNVLNMMQTGYNGTLRLTVMGFK